LQTGRTGETDASDEFTSVVKAYRDDIDAPDVFAVQKAPAVFADGAVLLNEVGGSGYLAKYTLLKAVTGSPTTLFAAPTDPESSATLNGNNFPVLTLISCRQYAGVAHSGEWPIVQLPIPVQLTTLLFLIHRYSP
jgi:hypothetical protein